MALALGAVTVAAAPDDICPGYLTIDPDSMATPAIEVLVQNRGKVWSHTALFPSRTRCVEAVRLLQATLAQVPTTAKVRVMTIYCDPDRGPG